MLNASSTDGKLHYQQTPSLYNNCVSLSNESLTLQLMVLLASRHSGSPTKHEIPNQNSRSHAMILFPLRVNMSSTTVRSVFNVSVSHSEQTIWFGISRMKHEIPNQNSCSQAMVPLPIRVNLLCITVRLVFMDKVYHRTASSACRFWSFYRKRWMHLNVSSSAFGKQIAKRVVFPMGMFVFQMISF